MQGVREKREGPKTNFLSITNNAETPLHVHLETTDYIKREGKVFGQYELRI
jgi:hypothetical protein